MQIDEITEGQLDLIMRHADRNPRYWIKPDVDKDTVDDFMAYTDTRKDILYLIKLGLLEEVSDDEEAKEIIADIQRQTKREACAITITNLGGMMFCAALNEKEPVN